MDTSKRFYIMASIVQLLLLAGIIIFMFQNFETKNRLKKTKYELVDVTSKLDTVKTQKDSITDSFNTVVGKNELYKSTIKDLEQKIKALKSQISKLNEKIIQYVDTPQDSLIKRITSLEKRIEPSNVAFVSWKEISNKLNSEIFKLRRN